MRIKLKATMAGPAGVFAAGTELEVGEETALSLIQGGYAQPVVSAAERETLPPGEEATGRGQRSRRREVTGTGEP